MIRLMSFSSLIAVALGSWWVACSAEEPAKTAPPPDLLVLRGGEVIGGRVAREGDSYRVTLSDGELRIHSRDVEVVCHTIDEAYTVKRSRLALGRADDHLDLADWCLRQKLPGNAAKEIAAAMALDPKNARADFLDRRLQQFLATPVTPPTEKNTADVHRVTNEDLDRLVRGLPGNSVENFTSSIQPLLMNSCATSGCHGPGSKSSYVIIRIPNDRTGNRRLTQRNLQSTVQNLDYQNPQQSKLLVAASRPHGTAASAIFDPQTAKYRQLYNWIALVTQKAPGTPDVPEPPATIGVAGQPGDIESNSAHTLNSTSGDDDSRPIKRPTPVRPPHVPVNASDAGRIGTGSELPPVVDKPK